MKLSCSGARLFLLGRLSNAGPRTRTTVYGDFGVADGALVGLREQVAGVVRGGKEDDEFFRGGSREGRS